MDENFLKRSIHGRDTQDSSVIDNVEHNSWAGGQKNLEVGPALEYIGSITTEVKVSKGDQLFIFKEAAGTSYVTMSETAGVVAGAAPAANVFPIFQGFTRYSAANYRYIISNVVGVHLYILKDDTKVRNNP
jgi:hypothetical protein